jgi:hypothetical protein
VTTKNYGPATSGYLDPDGRNWETTVFEAGKPVLDKELNLAQDVADGFAQAALRRGMPSGWISDDFLATSSTTSAIFTATSTANTFRLPQALVAHVNGWLLKVSHTNANGVNQLTLPVAPVGASIKRTDVVVLEVWRRLVSATGGVGKSSAGRIWQNGNVKTSPADDLALNFADDILDANVGSESTKRVQIQYRLRVIPGVDVFAYPYAMDDPSLVAYSVPASAGAPDGAATTFGFTNQLGAGDGGLWRAGDGNPANTIGSVDGYMYAIPLMAIFRRNQNAFDRNSNQNGGVASPGPSDRPDGLLFDIIDARDVADLRFGVSPSGWNYAEVLDKNLNLLLDNGMKSDWTLVPNGGGSHGHTVLWADEIGVLPGDSVTTGDTPGAAFIAQFDATRRKFSDRPVYEILTTKVSVPGGGWANSTFTIDFTSIDVYPYTAFNWASYAPGTVIAQDIVGATFIGATAGKKTLNAISHIKQTTNLGQVPIALLTLKMDALAGLGLTNEDLYVDILVCYPPGGGLTLTPTATYGSATYTINNPLALPGTAPVSYSALANTSIDAPHREVHLQYVTGNVTFSFAADTVAAATTFRMPERVQTIVSVLKNGTPIAGGTVISSDGKTVTLSNGADATAPGDVLAVTYTAVRPLPQNGEQLTIWYEGRAPQTARDALIGTTLTVVPRHLPSSLYTITCGSGSQDEGYPFPSAYVQTGGIYPSSSASFTGEHELSARAATSIADFSASTGFLKLPTFVPFVPNAESLTFTRSSPGDIDIENRTFFKTVPSGYIPNAYGQDLSDPSKHKVFYAFLAELPASSALGVKGQLVLVLLTRWAIFDETNGVFFNADLTQNTTTASVFRLKGNLLNRRG